jgi:ATP-dependent DNA helicase RecG
VATLSTLLRDALGGKASKALEKLGLTTVGDLLRHYPRRFSERGKLTDLSELAEGDEVTVMAEILSAKSRRIPGRKLNILEVVIVSGPHRASLSFFNQAWRERDLVPGRRGLFAGKVSRFRDRLQLNSPDYLLMGEDDPLQVGDFAGALIPVYPSVAGVPSWTLARCVKQALEGLDHVGDPLPRAIRARIGLRELDAGLVLGKTPACLR